MIRLDTSDEVAAPGWNVRACEPTEVLSCDARTRVTTLVDAGGAVVHEWADPVEALRWMPGRVAGSAARWVGYLGYDVGGLFEVLPSRAADDVGVPLFAFGLCDVEEKATLVAAHGRDAHATGNVAPSFEQGNERAREGWNFSRGEYEGAVARAIEYVRAGDVFQVNLSQRLARRTGASAREVYSRMREGTPAVFGGMLEFGEFAFASNSPELFFRLGADRRVMMRPIKGTRPAAAGMAEELRASEKDQAELAMIVDLIRNDLGRVAEVGSVRVTRPREIEVHPTVVHGVATVEGRLRGDVGWVEFLRAVFPCGSVTGAPKIRAMEIIDELEPHRRGAYCGAIGYLAGDGSAQFNVAIRTITFARGVAYVPVGGGIVADSTPAGEYEETLVKAVAMLRALGK